MTDDSNTHTRRVAAQLRLAAEDDTTDGDDEIYRIDCPECGHPVDEWCDCPQCGWFDIDRWRDELDVPDGGETDA